MKKCCILLSMIAIIPLFSGCSKDPKVEWNELNNQMAQLYQEGKYEEAIQLGEKTIQAGEKAFGPDHPNVAKSLYNIAGCYYIQNKLDKAEPLFNRALKIKTKAFGPMHPEVADLINLMGNIFSLQGKNHKAEGAYNDALTINIKLFGRNHQKVATVLGNLAAVYTSQGKFTKANRYYNTALQISPESQILLKNKAELLTTKENIAGAIAKELDTLKQSPDDPQLNWKLGNLYRESGNPMKAVEHYRKAISLNKNFIEAITDLADVYEEQKQFDKALEEVQNAMKLNPNRTDLYYWTSALLAQKNDEKESVQWLQKAVDKGYRNWARIKTDERLTSIRENKDYKNLLEQEKKQG